MILLFISSFLAVFLLGFQQLNVAGNHYISAVIVSFGISGCQIFLWRTIGDADSIGVLVTMAGGAFGIISAMYFHPKIFASIKLTQSKKNPRRAFKHREPD